MPSVYPLAVVFFVSGFAALLYQVVWQRLLAIFSGTDVYSATIIVAAFMGGLGLGHLTGGHIADRVSRRINLALFAAAELAIAAFGASSAGLYYGFLYQQFGPLELSRAAIAAVLFVSLLWPTFFMGASLPLLARAATERLDHAAAVIGALYGFNTIGAAAGAIAATWLLLPAVGLEGSLRAGAALNLACALAALPLALGIDASRAARPATNTVPAAAAVVARWPTGVWAALYGLAGFIALSYEILWFRLLGVMVKSTAFTFGTLLAVYLAGLGLGAAAGTTLARRVARPDLAFLLLQAAAGIVAGLLVGALVALADDIDALRDYFNAYEPLSMRDSVASLRALLRGLMQGTWDPSHAPANFLRVYVGLPLVLVALPTFLMGSAFPCLQRVAQTDVERVGRRVGTLLVANITGSILGTVLTGSVALAMLGTAATLKLLVIISSVFGFAALAIGAPYPAHAQAAQPRVAAPRLSSSDGRARLGPRAAAGAALAVLVTLGVAALPDSTTLWARLHGTTPDRMIVAEDDTGVAAIKAETERFAGTKTVFVNGLGQSGIPYGGVHTALAAVPAILHPHPREIAIIGLGSGDTAYAAAMRPETERVTCIEIIRPQLATLRHLAARDPYGGVRALVHHPRIEHVVGDGRAYLMRTARRFDIIEADALRPTSAYSGNMYSDGYFRLIRDRLKPGGLATTWLPTARVRDTFLSVFPYAVEVPGILIGSREPIHIDRDGVARRVADAEIRRHFAIAGIDIDALIGAALVPPPTPIGPDRPRRAPLGLNTDLFPRDEFDLTPPR